MCSALAEIGTDLEDREISESKIDPTSASVMDGIVLWAQYKKDEKWDVILKCPSGSLGESTVITDW
jgi:hypothetical protein